MSAIEAKLGDMGLTLPPTPRPAGNYVIATRSGGLVFVAGQLGTRDGQLVAKGAVGKDTTIEEAQEAARAAVLNALAAVKEVAGSLDNVVRVLRTVVYVNSASDFTQQAQVANGASDLLVGLFGEAGRHARSAVGMVSLPLGAAVEVELTVEVR